MIRNRRALNFRCVLLLLSVVLTLSVALPIKGNTKGDTIVVKLDTNIELSALIEKYPELKTALSASSSEKVFEKKTTLASRTKKLERRKRFGFMSSKAKKKLNTKLNELNTDLHRIETFKAKAIKKGTYPKLDNTLKVKLNSTTPSHIIALLNTLPEVQYAQPVLQVTTQALPNDKYVDPEQNNEWTTGTLSSEQADMWGLESSQAKQIWNTDNPTTGNTIIVAVIDTGIDPFHEDIDANLWRNENDEVGYDFVNNDAYPIDGHGHGTHVAGTIAAEMNNNLGISGIAPGVQVMSLKALSDSGSGSDNDIAEAIMFATDNGADIINLSLGAFGHSNIMEDAVNYAHALGVVVVAAAGNSADDAKHFSPAKFQNTIAVAALAPDSTPAYFSNYGDTVDVIAPGEKIISLRAAGTSMGTPLNDNYTMSDGTSMAAPHVAGTLALIKQEFPDATPDELAQILYQTTEDLGEEGKDTLYGYGKIQTYTAITNESLQFGNITSPTPGNFLSSNTITIKGDAYSDTFTSYEIHYKQTESDSWTLITSSTTPVTDATLATWDISSLETGIYTLKLTVFSGASYSNFEFENYHVDTRVKPGYPITIESSSLLSHPTTLRAGDTTTILAIASQNLYSLTPGLSEHTETYTPVASAASYFNLTPLNRAPTIGDIDHDGQKETIIGGRGTITIIEADNRTTVHDINDLLGGPFLINTIVLSDINKDTQSEIIFSASGRGIFVLKYEDGELAPYNDTWPFEGSYNTPLVADVDNDGTEDIITHTESGRIYILNHDGSTKTSLSIGINLDTDSFQNEVFIGDIDQDNDLEIGAVKITPGTLEVLVFHHNGILVDGWPFIHTNTYYNTSEAPVVADINGDSTPEIIVAQQSWNGTDLFFLTPEGDMLYDQSTPHSFTDLYAKHGAILITDVNNDNKNDVILGLSGSTTKIKCIDHLGNNAIQDMSIASIESPFDTSIALLISDIDANGKIDIVSLATNTLDQSTVITAHELEATTETKPDQRLTYRGNAQLTGLSQAPLQDTLPVSSLGTHLSSLSSISFNWSLPGYTPSGIFVTIIDESAPRIELHSDTYTDSEVTITGLELSKINTYIITLKALVGDEYSAISTYRLNIDTTAPEIHAITITHPSQHIVNIAVTAHDEETEISGFTYALGSAPFQTDIQDWTVNNSETTQIDVSSYVATEPTSELPSKIYVQAKARNKGGLESTVLSETIDYTYLIPEAPLLNASAAFASDENLQFIDWEEANTLFELTTIHYGLGSSAIEPDFSGWKSLPADETRLPLINLNLTHGESYVLFIKAENELGMISNKKTKTITLDVTPPSTPRILEGLKHITSDTVTFSVTSTDNESDIQQYWVAIGSELHLNDVLDWQAQGTTSEFDISHLYQTRLHHLPYFYVKVKSENKAGLQSDSITHKVSTDIETPRVSNIQINGNEINENSEFTGYLNLSFTATDNTSIESVEILLLDNTQTTISTLQPDTSYASLYLATFLEVLENKGSYSIRIQISDDAGNTVYYTSPSFTYINLETEDINPPHIHTIEVNNKELLANDILTDSLNFNLNIEDNTSISRVTLILKDAQNNVIQALVAEKQGNTYTATFDKSLFNDNHKYEIEIVATDLSANEISSKTSFTFADIETFEVSNVLPYPNPFNPDIETSKIRFNLEGQSVVKLYVHSITGKRIYTYSALHETGAQILEWDGKDDFGNDVAMGVYFAYLIVESTTNSDSFKQILKLAVLK